MARRRQLICAATTPRAAGFPAEAMIDDGPVRALDIEGRLPASR